ncbi:hypothetical protein LEP1GSC047_2263 [Leptospira inadai serovar Lyme str. 10]|uniref:Uncharacterized protein n=2 Tax=Leptospira inadai serovar Lyme TaxID=293084 RepID=V6HFT8_9LEPT|nr:hypothetical protein [Leptospira inadai]EQA38743.1 hypothetical protein LEP1GSC047_2263 [Leptospira inadai serovar Lyme str. 10]PNV72243.1 hypothetical protein BES34_019820 [Leptospira inadai serovar Lyme]
MTKSFFPMKLAVLGFLLATSYGVIAQNKPQANDSKTAELASVADDPKYQGDYLEEFHYARTLDSTQTRLKHDLAALQIVVKNFGSQVQGSQEEFDSIWKKYNEAYKFYLMRKYVVSGRKTKETELATNKLYGKFSDLYNQKVDQLLGECADTIVGVEQKQAPADAAKGNAGRDISQNHHKLQIAYYEYIQAERMRKDSRFKDSLVHLRLAKEYGISILSRLKPEEESKTVREKYKVDLSDNRNLIFSESKL